MPLLGVARSADGSEASSQQERTYLLHMPPLTEARKQEIRTAISANRKPNRGASNRTILVTGNGPNRRQNKYVVLADGAGKLTAAGTFYY